MTQTAIFAALALIGLLCLSAASLMPGRRPDMQSVIALFVSIVGTILWIWSREWGLGLPTALLASVLATELAFAILLLRSRACVQLGGLVGPYLLFSCLLVVWSDIAFDFKSFEFHLSGLLSAHIGAAVLSYGFVTLGAMASLAIIMRERSLKRRTRGWFIDRLPAIAEAEATEIRGLTAAEIVLGIGILLGVAAEYSVSGNFLQITHKSLFSLAAFAVIGGLLFLHLKTGLRGRMAARIGLSAYLLVSLGYPGAKFVSDILLA